MANLSDLKIQYEKMGEEIKKLEEAEKDRLTIRLKKPRGGMIDTYYAVDGHGDLTAMMSSETITPNYYRAFCSTNKVQAKVFRNAIAVMAELRTQPGIAIPTGRSNFWTIEYNLQTEKLRVTPFSSTNFQAVAPGFETEVAAENACNAVGNAFIIDAFKTLLFLSPESRGEVD